MKNNVPFLTALLIVNMGFAKVSIESMDPAFICNETAYFIEPYQQNIAVGEDVYVKVKFNEDRFVTSVKLYIGHQPIRVDGAAPYEWGLPNGTADSQLRNMQAGNYSLTAEVRYSCGNKRTFTKHIKVGSSAITIVKYNPIYSLVWLKRIHQTQPNSKISEYKKGSNTFYKVEPCSSKVGFISWYDPRGRLSGKFRSNSNSQGQFHYAKLIKAWHDPCR